MKSPRVQFEHPTQLAASAFLRALSEGDAATAWEHLSRETRGLLEGLYAARNAVALHRAAVVAALGVDRLGGFGVSGARVVDRNTAYVLLLPEFGDERKIADERLSGEQPADRPSVGRLGYMDDVHVEIGVADQMCGGFPKNAVTDDPDLADTGAI